MQQNNLDAGMHFMLFDKPTHPPLGKTCYKKGLVIQGLILSRLRACPRVVPPPLSMSSYICIVQHLLSLSS